jgi:hypothetical protein
MTLSEIKNRAIASIPILIRGVRFTAVMGVFMDSIQSSFWDFSGSVRVDLRKNGQVLNLEQSLNDRFDPVLRRIYIDDSTNAGIMPAILYNAVELNPSLVLYNWGENGHAQAIYNLSERVSADFIIYSPVAMADFRIRDLIRKIPIGQRRYQIVLI